MLEVKSGLKAYVEHQLADQRTPKPGAAERPFTTIKSKALYNLQFRATVEGHSFVSDERESASGNDAGPAPMRYFLAGAMMCHQVWCVKSASLVGVQIDRLECEIRGFVEHATGPDDVDADRGIGRVGYTVEIDSPASADEVWSVVDLGAHRCPAFVTLSRGTRIDLELIHNGVKLGERAYGSGR
jgi:uncharacterized OsmC-like protein